MAQNKFGWKEVGIRLIVAITLVFASYNPSGFSFYHWAIDPIFSTELANELVPFKVLVGILLFIGWAIFLRATYRSLGPIGTILAVSFFCVLFWLAIDLGLISLDSVSAVSYLVEIGLSGVLAAGISWSHIRRRMTGQLDVDEVEGE